MNFWLGFAVWYIVVMWILGILFVRSGRKGVSYTDIKNYEQDGAAVLTAPIWMPVTILMYVFSNGLALIGRLASGIPFEESKR